MATETMYSCPPSTEADLVRAGATRLSITYQYEVETSSETAVAAAVERVEAAMLRSVAEQSGLVGCAGQEDPWRRLGDGDRRTRRRLRAGGRGSNSVVGLSSNPTDEPSGTPCRFDAAKVSSKRSDPFAMAEREVLPGHAGAVVVGEELDESDSAADASGDDVELDFTPSIRIDGAEVHESVQRADSDKNGDRRLDEGSNDNLGMDFLAFNYVSTQSLPIERTSRTSHNPLTPPAIFQEDSKMNTRPVIGAEQPDSTLVVRPRLSMKCSVIEGRMSAYSTATEAEAAYENLEGRILASLVDDVNANGADFADDIVLGVRMYDDSGNDSVAKDHISESPGYVSAVQGGPGDAHPLQENSFSFFTVPMAVLVALGCLLIVLAALFVRTSQPKRYKSVGSGSSKWDESDEPSVTKTYYDDEVEMDVHAIEKDLRAMESRDDYSVDQFSVRTAKDSVVRPLGILNATSFGSRGKRSARRTSAAKKRGATAAAIPGKAGSVANYAVVDASDGTTRIPAGGGAAAEDAKDASFFDSPFFGLFATRSRGTSPDTVEPDVTMDKDERTAAATAPAKTRSAAKKPVVDAADGATCTGAVGGASARAASKGAAEDSNETSVFESPFFGLFAARPTMTADTEVELDVTSVHDRTAATAPARARSAPDEGALARAASEGAAADSSFESTFLGLFGGRPRATSPDAEVELDVASVYDCDDGVESVDTEIHEILSPAKEGGVAEDDGDVQPAVKPSKSFLGGLLRARSKARAKSRDEDNDEDDDVPLETGGKKPVYRDGDEVEASFAGPVDTDAVSTSSNKNRDVAPTGRAPTPRDVSDPADRAKSPASSSSLQFFAARGSGCVSPHSEVEASLKPFDECSEYSTSAADDKEGRRSVRTDVFFTRYTDGDRIVLSKDEERGRTRMVRKFNKFVQRARSPLGGRGGDDAREIHQVYSQDDGDAPRRKGRRGAQDATPVYTMQRVPSTLPPSASSAQKNGPNDKGGPSQLVVMKDEESLSTWDGAMCGVDDCLVPECLLDRIYR